MAKIIKYKQTLKMRIRFFGPYVLAAVMVFLWDWQRLDFKTWNELFTNTFSALFGYVLLYILACVASYGIFKLFSETEFIKDSEYKKLIDELICESSQFLYIITPYLDPGNNVIESIISAKGRGVKVILVHHSSQLTKLNCREWIERLTIAGVDIYHHPHLHAKIYANEHGFVIGSMNLVSSSYNNSFECGIKGNNLEIRKDLMNYIEDKIIDSDLLSRTEPSDAPPKFGFCIRTRKQIEFDPKRPIEYNEFKQVGRMADGKFCHACGVETKTSVERPLCSACAEIKHLNDFREGTGSSA